MSQKRKLSEQPPTDDFASKRRKISDKSDEEQEVEDDDGCLLTSELDYDIQTGLHALRNNNPLIYDSNYNFIENNEKKEMTTDTNDNKYPWVKQLDDNEQDRFLQTFFSKQLWKCKDENDKILTSIPVHRGYKGFKHNLDDIDLSDDDINVDKQNDFERQWQQKNALQFEKETIEQNNKLLNDHQNKNKDEHETCKLLAFLEDSD
eukprot:369778_1